MQELCVEHLYCVLKIKEAITLVTARTIYVNSLWINLQNCLAVVISRLLASTHLHSKLMSTGVQLRL